MSQFDPYLFAPALARGKLKTLLATPEDCIAEYKLDGVRQLLWNLNGEVYMTGRRSSDVTGLKLNKIDHVPHLRNLFASACCKDCAIDGEILTTDLNGNIVLGTSNEVVSILGSNWDLSVRKQDAKGMLAFIAFDIVLYQGQDVRFRPYSARLQLLHDLLNDLIGTSHLRSIHSLNNFEAMNTAQEPKAIAGPLAVSTPPPFSYWFDHALNEGYEGLVIKHINGLYDSRYWAKMKPVNTYEMILMGYEQSDSETFAGNGIAALKLGLRNSHDQTVHVTDCSGMLHYWRREFFANGGAYLNTVVEVKAQDMFDTGALRHPRFKGLRPDANPQEQTFAKYGVKES